MDDLVLLVNALSVTEKQHFKKKNDPSSDFVLLFDYINKNKAVNNPAAILYLSKKRKNKKALSSSYLSVIKGYLKNKILESLRIQFIQKKRNNELMASSINTDILLEKGLYSLAKNEIEKSLDKNLDSSFPIERLLLLRRKSLLDYFENYENTNLEKINLLFESRLASVEQLTMEIKFARILSILSYQYFRGQNNPELLKTFMAEPYMQDKTLSSDFSTQYLFHWVHAQFEEFQNNNEKALNHFNKSIRIWLNNPKYIEAHPRMYLGACFAYFKYLLQQKEPFSKVLSDLNFDELMSKMTGKNLSSEERVKYSIIFNLVKIISLRENNKSAEMLNLLNNFTENKNHYYTIPDFEKVIFYYYSALANFIEGNLNQTIDILSDLINPLDHRLSCNPVYITVYIQLYLITLFDGGNEKLLRNSLPKFKKFLIKEGRLTQFETHFFNMISQLLSPRYKDLHDAVYDRFYSKLHAALQDDDRGLKLEYEFLLNWVKTKVTE